MSWGTKGMKARQEGRQEARAVRKGQGTFGQASRRDLRKDMKAKDEGKLGLSQAEKRQAVQETTTAAGTQMSKQMELAARQKLGGVEGTALSPEEIAETSAQTAAEGSMAVDLASKELAENRRKEIVARMNRQQDINRATTQHYADWALELALDPTGGVFSGGGGGGGGGGGAQAGAGKLMEMFG